MDILVTGFQLLAVMLSFFFIIFVVRQRHSLLCSYLLVYTIAVFLYELAYLFEIKSQMIEEALLAVRFEYLAHSAAVIASFFFTSELFRAKIRTWFRVLYISAFVVTCTFVATNPLHHLHYSEYWLEVREHFSALHMEIGIIYVIHTAISLTSMAMCAGVIVTAWIRDAKRKEDYKKYLFFGIAVLLPLIFWSVRFAAPIKDYDLIPFSMFCTACCFVLILYFFRIFDVAEYAKNEVLETMDEGILVCDEEGKIVYTNARVREIFQNVPLKEISEVLQGLVPTEDGDFCIGGHYYSVMESEVYEGNRVKGKTLCFIDITQSKEKELQLRELRDAALAANRAKSSFLANMSHEIRTPINTILGMGELILREANNPNILEYAENIEAEGRTLIALINDLLDFSKIESNKMEIRETEYSIASLLHDIVAMFSIKMEEKGLDFRAKVEEDIPAVLFGDELRIRQILSNILSNAVKYTERGGVWMKAKWNLLEEGQGELVISVRDSGIGIRKEDLEVIFEKFRRVDVERNSRIEGTGLGMSITAQLLDLMHGGITVESEYGIGSEFKVRIPQRVIDATPIGNYSFLPEAKKEPLQAIFTAPAAKILVVDDNVMNRVVVKGLLKRTLVQVDEAVSGRECLKKTENNYYDVILLDHMMPEMDGIQTLEQLKKQDGACKTSVVIVLTANAVAGAKKFYMEKGFHDYLSKPVSGVLLEKMLLKYLPPELVTEGPHPAGSDTVEMRQTKDSTEDIRRLLTAEHIDMQGSLESFGGDEEMYHETVRLFFNLREERMKRLQEYLRTGDTASYAILAHSIQGDAKMLGMPVLAEIAQEQEEMGKEGNLSFLRDTFVRLLAEYQRTATCFERVFGRMEPPSREPLERETSPEQTSPSELVGFSYADGLRNFDGNEEVYRETLLLFAELWAEREEKLRAFLSQGNMKDYAILIHAVKGDAKTLGADTLAELAYEQEQQAKAGDAEAVAGGFDHILQTVKTAVEYFRETFGKQIE